MPITVSLLNVFSNKILVYEFSLVSPAAPPFFVLSSHHSRLSISWCRYSWKSLIWVSIRKMAENVRNKKSGKWIVALKNWKEPKRLQIICQLCQKIHHKFSDYEIHFLTHFQVGNECKKCKDQKFSNVKNHIFERHEKFTPPLIKCFNKCQFATRSLAIFRHHCQLEGHEKIEDIEENLEIFDMENKENIEKIYHSTPKIKSKKFRKSRILRVWKLEKLL